MPLRPLPDFPEIASRALALQSGSPGNRSCAAASRSYRLPDRSRSALPIRASCRSPPLVSRQRQTGRKDISCVRLSQRAAPAPRHCCPFRRGHPPGITGAQASVRVQPPRGSPPSFLRWTRRPPSLVGAIVYGQCVCRYCASAIRMAAATGVMLLPVCACTSLMNALYRFLAGVH